jgi:hypothetical protein
MINQRIYAHLQHHLEVMENIFRDVEYTEVYNGNIGAFSHSWDDIIALLCTILTKLQNNGFMVNPLKCKLAFKETDWLYYWLTPIGLQPYHARRQASCILQQEA